MFTTVTLYLCLSLYHTSSSSVMAFDITTTESLAQLFRIDNATEESTTDLYTNETYEEVCVGDPDYCNLTKEEYVALLDEYIFPQPYEWVLIASHSVVFIVGLVGNALVCVAVYRNHSMRTVTNYFIVNLAVADFMVILFCLPPTVLWDVTETWFFGNAMCRIVLYFQVSRFTLTFIMCEDLPAYIRKHFGNNTVAESNK